MSEPYKNNCVGSSQVLSISHDEVNHFLSGSNFSGKYLFNQSSPAIETARGVLSVDDIVSYKSFSDPKCKKRVRALISFKFIV